VSPVNILHALIDSTTSTYLFSVFKQIVDCYLQCPCYDYPH